MNDMRSYATKVGEVESLCQAAAERGIKELDELGQILKLAEVRECSAWPEDVLAAWTAGLETVAETMDMRKLSAEDSRLLLAMMELGFDKHVFRECYAGLAKATFGGVYSNLVDLTDAFGFLDDSVKVQTLAGRWKMMELLKVGTLCYDAAFGGGLVVDIDALAGEIIVQMERKRGMRLRNFLDTVLIIRSGSKLHDLLNRRGIPSYSGREAYLADLKESMVSLAKFDLEATAKKMIVPEILSENAYVSMTTGQKEAAAPAAQGTVQHSDARRWDTSRSIAELAERLKDSTSLKVEDANLGSVHTILVAAARRVDQSEMFALSLAMIWKDGSYNERLGGLLDEVGTTAAIWNTPSLYVTITDKLPGKLVPYWFEVTKKACGDDFLVAQTMQLPYRLWAYAQKLLPSTGKGRDLLVDRVLKAFEAGRVNAEMYFWLWKWKPAAEDEELRMRFMSDSYLLFKTLRIEVRGNYLKSQRTLHHMLVDDEEFQRQVMKHGDMEAIRSLVRCVKHQPLLDAGERQSLLVKIVRHYPEAIHEVEERRTGPVKRAQSKITSNRSYHDLELELQDIIDVQIPENIKAIEHARSLGDLRENSEFKFAKERQGLLQNRRNELETNLSETRPTDFRDVKVDKIVVPGCTVEVAYVKNGKTEQFHVLGRFDSIPEKNIISYESPLGDVLCGAKIGDDLKMPSGDDAKLAAILPLTEEMLAWLGTTAD